jgi:two-component system, NtrC family, sensor kinase
MGRRAKPAKGKESPNSEVSGVRDLDKRLAEAQEQQAATAEILRVISSSPTNVQPVFDAIASSALRLCDGVASFVFRHDGTLIHLAAVDSVEGVDLQPLRHTFPAPPERATFAGRVVATARLSYIADIEHDPDAPSGLVEAARANGYRSIFAAPMLRGGRAIGVIGVFHRNVGGFTREQGALLQTFADQAVIAIENVRLFNETKESLDRQTATSEILRVIASSPTDLQPVLDALARSAVRFCGAYDATLFQVDGETYRVVAHHGPIPFPLGARFPLVRGYVTGRSILDRQPVHVADLQAETSDFPQGSALASENGQRTTVAVPLLREGQAIGTVQLRRTEARPFSDKEIALLKTFADQAVIAIENVRLFKELQERNRDLTATSEILRVIANSPTDARPVFDVIVRSAVRLCDGLFGAAFRFDGELLHLAAHHNYTPEAYEALRQMMPMRPRPDSPLTAARAILTRDVVQVADVQLDHPEYTDYARAQEIARAAGFRSVLAVPMLRDATPVGAMVVARRQPGPFASAQVALLKTFAEQAVIAIENTRLFKELEARTEQLTRSVGELTALGEVSRALSSTLNLETVLQTIVMRANEIAWTAGCTIWEYDEPRAEFQLRASHYADHADAALLQAPGRVTAIARGQGVTSRVMERREPVQINDIAIEGFYESPIRRPLIEAGHRALLGVPLLSEDEVIGVLAVTRKTPGEFEPEVVRLLSTFATQSALAIQNARLFLEIEDKSRQLEVASQHKSEFLANMSHELRTPLNAIIGFSEVLTERMFGELNEKQDEYLKDIYASGQHLLSLINDILDLSKIEAGRMELEPTEFDLPSAIDNAVTLVRERAGRRGITLGREIDSRVGMIRGDERKVKQVVLNLLSNAIKFTPEGGRIDVRAVVNDGTVEVSVIDTGVGIAPEDQETVFDEFRQVGTADKKVEGTGLGLALSRKFVELHGGRIWVESEVGQGSTFTFTIPVRASA